MLTKVSTLTCVAWATAAILGAGIAKANLVSKQSGTSVTITPRYRTVQNDICGYLFDYEQFMIIEGGQADWVPTQWIYPSGHEMLSPYPTPCEDGYILYGVGDCACSTATGLDDADSCQVTLPDDR